ncbi:hypothetical protein CDO73_09365 [Saccharibacillus sp. O23]|uniref:WD40/YVTN/BNR-like repeat-containing protein n=1 Tax=Saccharibacillus sp. O23 TaxID=2009338 RepID=UPI000B4E49F9|nr:hypothetical protein [Saccharibacillus sp. O23]OWR30789.1 hypothetical protein CDO73_09365 [Saccharibacillus sp. O23]
MNTRRRFSIYTGLCAALILAGGLLAGCSDNGKLSDAGTPALAVPPSSVVYEKPLAAEPDTNKTKIDQKEAAQAGTVFLDNGSTGWKVDMRTKGALAADNTLYRTGDGGETWTKIADSASGSLPSGLIAALRFVDEQRGWAATNTLQEGDLRLYATRDGGKTWSKTALAIPADFERSWFEAKVPVFFEGTDLGLYIAQTEFASDGKEARPLLFYVTSDGGATWSDPLRSEQGEYGGVSWKTKRLADGTGRSWSVTISGRTWTFERSDG